MNQEYGERRIVIFDGICNLCNRTVDFLLKNDPDGKLFFLPLQSLVETGISPPGQDSRPAGNTVIFIDRGEVYTRSAAILRISGYLRFPWPVLRILYILPRPVRDWSYDLIARKRYQWFGKRNECRVMAPGDPYASRFLSESDQALRRIIKSSTDKII